MICGLHSGKDLEQKFGLFHSKRGWAGNLRGLAGNLRGLAVVH